MNTILFVLVRLPFGLLMAWLGDTYLAAHFLDPRPRRPLNAEETGAAVKLMLDQQF